VVHGVHAQMLALLLPPPGPLLPTHTQPLTRLVPHAARSTRRARSSVCTRAGPHTRRPFVTSDLLPFHMGNLCGVSGRDDAAIDNKTLGAKIEEATAAKPAAVTKAVEPPAPAGPTRTQESLAALCKRYNLGHPKSNVIDDCIDKITKGEGRDLRHQVRALCVSDLCAVIDEPVLGMLLRVISYTLSMFPSPPPTGPNQSKDYHGYTALNWSAANGHVNAAKALIEADGSADHIRLTVCSSSFIARHARHMLGDGMVQLVV